MKHQLKLCLLACILLCTSLFSAKADGVKVDELFEYTSIVWRIAGANEYRDCHLKSYSNDIDRHFARHERHPLIEHCKKVRNRHYIAFDAIAPISAYLQLRNDSIVFFEGYNADSIMDADFRWAACGKEAVDKYVRLLDEFYRDSDFKRFWNSHKPLYDRIEHELDSLGKARINTSWFEHFLGMPVEEFHIFASVNNGLSNYGLTKKFPSAKRGMLLGVVSGEHNGKLRYLSSINELAVHELMHSYANPESHKWRDSMQKASDILFARDEGSFLEQHYNEDAVPVEWLNRLLVIMYYMDNNKGFGRQKLASEIQNGFFWMGHSVEIMKQYTGNRDRYKTISDFMPVLVEHYNLVASHTDYEQDIAATYFPRIESVTPAPGSKLDFSQDSVVITVRFDTDMYTKADGRTLLFKRIHRRCPNHNDNDVLTYWSDNRTYTIRLSSKIAKAKRFYGFILDGYSMLSWLDEVQIPMQSEQTKITYKL